MNKSNRKFKLNFKKSVFLSCVILGISLLTACGSSDKTLPIIESVALFPSSVKITANDDIGVTGYALTTSLDKPNAKDDVWTTNTEFTLEAMGTFYAYAKDEAGNVSESYLVDITNNTTLERLAKEYDHLAWIIAPDTAETKALKDKYGDLYPMVEPLTEQQIKDRWVYLVNYLVKEKPNNGAVYASGLYQLPLGENFYNTILNFRNDYKKEILNSSDIKISKYSSYYKYRESLQQYGINTPEAFTSSETRHNVGLDIIDKVPHEDMEWFVRNYMVEAYKTINMAIESNAEMIFYFDPLLK